MRLLFRVDASYQMGSGHVMRCLTLAEAARSRGATSAFVCRELDGNLIHAVEDRGHQVHQLPPDPTRPVRHSSNPSITDWLNADIEADAHQTSQIVTEFRPEWLVIDHYGIDSTWERRVRRRDLKLMAIDDLANRPHHVDVLVDQNLGRTARDYAHLINRDCRVLIGPQFAMLRPEFARLRPAALARRESPRLEKLLVSMGGADPTNLTGQILELLGTPAAGTSQLKSIAVILGAQSLWRDAVAAQATKMPFQTDVLMAVDDMAARMLNADLAIGAGGTTSWERCCLGLPSIVLSVADNQVPISESLDRAGAAFNAGEARLAGWKHNFLRAFDEIAGDSGILKRMSDRAFSLTDGLGVVRLMREVLDY